MCFILVLYRAFMLSTFIAKLALADDGWLGYQAIDRRRDCFDECLKLRLSSSQADSICHQMCPRARRKRRVVIDQATQYDCKPTSDRRKHEVGNITNIAVNFTQHRLQNGTIVGWTANLTWDIVYFNSSLYSSDAWKGFEIRWVKGKEKDAKIHCRFNNKSVTWTTIDALGKSDFPLYVVILLYPSSLYEQTEIPMKKFYPKGIFQPSSTLVSGSPGPSGDRIYYIIGGISVGLFVTIVLLLLVYLHRRRTDSTGINPPDSSRKEYDTSIIFSSKDEKFVVKKLLQFLEKEKHLKCCVHFRNWEPGENVYQSMCNMVYNCKKVIAVISKHFLASNFCKEELNIALGRLASQGDSSIIVINLGVGLEDLPPPLRTRTFIDMTSSSEKKTWRTRLERQISGENATNVYSEIIEDNRLNNSWENLQSEVSCEETAVVKALIHHEVHSHINDCDSSNNTISNPV